MNRGNRPAPLPVCPVCAPYLDFCLLTAFESPISGSISSPHSRPAPPDSWRGNAVPDRPERAASREQRTDPVPLEPRCSCAGSAVPASGRGRTTHPRAHLRPGPRHLRRFRRAPGLPRRTWQVSRTSTSRLRAQQKSGCEGPSRRSERADAPGFTCARPMRAISGSPTRDGASVPGWSGLAESPYDVSAETFGAEGLDHVGNRHGGVERDASILLVAHAGRGHAEAGENRVERPHLTTVPAQDQRGREPPPREASRAAGPALTPPPVVARARSSSHPR
jgi:hypothetical protein